MSRLRFRVAQFLRLEKNIFVLSKVMSQVGNFSETCTEKLHDGIVVLSAAEHARGGRACVWSLSAP